MIRGIETTTDPKGNVIIRCKPTPANLEKFAEALSRYLKPDPTFVCIGSVKENTADSLGLRVGTNLQRYKVASVFGTNAKTVHALNLADLIGNLPKDTFKVAVDASHGPKQNIGTISLKLSPMKPGTGVGKNLPEVGSVSIYGCVAEDVGRNFDNYLNLWDMDSRKVQVMAHFIAKAIVKAIEIQNQSIFLNSNIEPVAIKPTVKSNVYRVNFR